MGAASFKIRQFLAALPWVGVFILLFWPTFLWMAERFSAHDSFYSHGWLVPFASSWLAQRRWKSFYWAASPNAAGLAVLLPFLSLHVLASLLSIHVLSGMAMLGVLWGLVWTLWGWRAVSALRFPLFFLGFMVPLPGILLIAVSFKMKLSAAAMAVRALNLMEIPAAQAGSTIHVPNISVVVDDVCSGLRSLISLLALSVFWAALLPRAAKRWHKLAIVAASIPIALLSNMVRIILLVLIAAIYGAAAAQGFLHYASGIVVFCVSLSLLVGLTRLLIPASGPVVA